MRSSSLKLSFVVVLSLMFGFALSRADDFSWNQAAGPPQLLNASCSLSAACTDNACHAVNPPVSVVPDGKTSSVVVKSYKKWSSTLYGTCDTGVSGTCYAYPNVPCADIQLYGMPGCMFDDRVGFTTVYAGNCTPGGGLITVEVAP